MNVSEALTERHSVRDFSGRPVADEVIDALLAKALLSPSWSNTQPYRVAVANGDLTARLAAAYSRKFAAISTLQRRPRWQQGLLGVLRGALPDGDFRPIHEYPAELHKRRVATGVGLYNHLGIARHDFAARDRQMARNFEFFGAPAALFLFVHEGLGAYSVLDAGIFLQSLMLAATEAGLSTCAQGALAMWRSPLDEVFDIPRHYKLICGMALGYASDHDVNRFRTGRCDLEEMRIRRK